jgi:hypothetical protein
MNQIVELFEQATGLSINYHKTISLLVDISNDTAQDLASAFGTIVSSFPKPILASPCLLRISITKCLPLISSCKPLWLAGFPSKQG